MGRVRCTLQPRFVTPVVAVAVMLAIGIALLPRDSAWGQYWPYVFGAVGVITAGLIQNWNDRRGGNRS